MYLFKLRLPTDRTRAMVTILAFRITQSTIFLFIVGTSSSGNFQIHFKNVFEDNIFKEKFKIKLLKFLTANTTTVRILSIFPALSIEHSGI
jgi:hypothetical protein